MSTNKGHFKPGHQPWNTRTTPGCGKPGHDTDYITTRSNGTKLKRCHECLKEANREAAKKRHARYRADALAAYGGKCSCCGEDHEVFLAIDHVNDDGNVQRAEFKGGGSFKMYRWLKENGYPEGYQILCHNCNYAKSQPSGCPHKEVM